MTKKHKTAINLAYDFFATGEPTEAEKQCTKLLANNENHAAALYLLGIVKDTSGK